MITKGGSRSRSTDTMLRPHGEIGGCRARGRALSLMVRAVSTTFTCTRTAESPQNYEGTLEAPPAEQLTLRRVSV